MISQFFISRPKFAFVVSIVIVIAGLIAIETLPVAQYPEICPPAVSVTALYPGANAETVEKTVLTPLEAQINGVEKMIYMSSTAANDGSASITVTFEIGTDYNMNTVNVQNRVSQALAQLPAEVTKQAVTVKAKSTDMLAIIDVFSPNNKYDGIFLSNYAAINIRDAIMRIKGVGDAQILGSQDYSMRIWLDPNKLTSLKISADEVIAAISEQNAQVAAGQIGGEPASKNQQFQYTVLTKGRLSSEEEFGNIILRENSDGDAVKLKDVAKIELGSYSYSSFGELNNNPAALLAIYQLPGSNAVEIDRKVKEELKKLSKNFPDGVDAKILYNTTNYVISSIQEVVTTLFIAVFLVILVTYLFLQDWRSALIPALAIPVSLIGTFAVLLAVGYTINTITLFGLILAIGIVVDDAIVVIENVHRIMEEEHLSPADAARKSMRQVTSPIIATTLVLMAMFVPVAFLPGITGELYRQFGITIAVSVGISSINALTLSPALCATLLKERHPKLPIFFVWFNNFFDYFKRKYNYVVAISLRRTSLVIGIMLIIFVSLFLLYKHLPSGFLPDEDQGVIMMNVQLPDAASIKRTTEIVHKVTDMIKGIKGVKDVQTVTGYSMFSGASSSNNALIIVVLKSWDERKAKDESSVAIANRANILTSTIPGASIFGFILPPIQGLGTTGGFEFILQDTTGNNPQRMAEVLRTLTSAAMNTQAIDIAYTMYRANVPQIYLDIDREKVKKLGIQLSDVFTTLQTYLGSIYVNDFNKFGKVYKVYVQAMPDYRSEENDVFNLYVKNANNQMVPLKTLIRAKKILAPEIIYHYNMFASATINGTTAPDFSSGQAIKTMEKVADELLPEGMSYEWTGTAYQEILAGSKVIFIFILAITFIYLFLVAQYESWTLAFSVMLSVPVGFLGALIGIWIAGIANNIYAQLGFVLVFGLAAKTAILIVEFAKKQREEEGKSIIEAAKMAANLRFRAVIMTMSSFVLGVVPLVIATGAGASSRRALGTAVFGGTLMAGIIGTILIPSFYAIIQKRKERFKEKNS